MKKHLIPIGLCVILVVLMMATLLIPAMADAGSSSGGGQAPEESKLDLPKAFGEARGVRVAPALGAVADQIQLIVPPGRRSVEPHLTLNYSSMGGLGILGLGWSLETGYVEVWRGDGVPTVSNPDSFFYSLAGAGGQLLNIGNGVYRAKFESIYREFQFNEEHGGWEMYNGEGTLHRFGGTPNSRISNQRWMLDLVQDPHGNTMTYTYQRWGNVLYISEIRYTGYAPASDPGANLVKFEYEEREDARIVNGLSVRQENTHRLQSISMFAGSQLARRYEFVYENNPLNGRSMLKDIILVGADGYSSIKLRQLEYDTRSYGWNIQQMTLPPFVDSEGRDTGNRMLDVNGDGFADIISNGNVPGAIQVALGTGNGFDESEASTWTESINAANVQFAIAAGDYTGVDTGVRLLDVNSDGLPDIFIAQENRHQIYLNTGHDWSYTEMICSGDLCTTGEQWSTGAFSLDSISSQAIYEHLNTDQTNCQFALVSGHGDFKGVQLADVNADGRADIIWSYSLQNPPSDAFNCLADIRGVFLNTGTGWKRDQTLTTALSDLDYFARDTQSMGYDLLDVNGDGFSDFVRTLADQPREVLLGTGSGWEYDAGFSASLLANDILSMSSDYKGQGLMPIDFNDDGLVDYLQANGNTSKAYANTGMGWIEAPEMGSLLATLGISFSTSDGTGTGITIGDINGDGLVDFTESKSGQAGKAYLSEGLRSGLLVRTTSALGEVTELTWTSSTQFDNSREDGAQGLPGPMPVVTSLTRKDGRNNSDITTYTYGGGWFTNRQFRGFRWTQQMLPSGLRMETIHYQDEGIAGQMAVENGYDAQNNLRLQKSSSLEVIEAASGVKQIINIFSGEVWSDPGGSRSSETRYTYDEYLNITSVFRDSDTEIDGDELTTTFAWIINTTAGFWNLPSRITAHGAGDSVLAENVMTYDNLPEGQIQYGLPSHVYDLVEPGRYVVKSMEYDIYGNVVRVHDRENNLSQFQYDQETATFLVGAIDAENRVQQSKYDPRFGELIWDKDAAGNIITKEYDTFGRLVCETLPGDEDSPNGTKTIVYSEIGDANTQFYTIKKTETFGDPGTLDTTYFFNGMGLVYRAERESSGSRKVVALTEYDDADNPVKTSQPFFEGDEPQWTIFERDALHRPLVIIGPDDSQINTAYVGNRIDMVDQRGTEMSFYRDAEGNTTAVHQWVDGVEQVTSYQYDELGQLVRIVDALSEQTNITYDSLGRRIRLDDPNTGTYLYRYDDNDNLIQQTGPDGGFTIFEYDHTGNLLRKRFPDGSVQEFIYDAAGRLVKAMDAAGIVEVTYDGRGNVLERTRTALGKAYSTKYAYDSLDRPRRVTYPDGFAVRYEYDAGGNLARISDNDGRTIADHMSYTAAGQLLEIRFGNGVTSNFNYDELMRMTSINTVTSQGETLQKLAYDYDAGSNLVSVTDQAFKASQDFEYDAIGRLIKATGAYGEETYEYDAIGNLIRKGNLVFGFDPAHPQRVICGSALAQGNANGIGNNPHADPCTNLPQTMNQGVDKKPGQIGGPLNNPNIAASFQVAYDAYGNVIQKGGLNYEYDFENHLISVRDAKGKTLAKNVYDAGGQRVVQQTPQGNTIYIDGIYEEGKTHTSRHVQAGPLLIATIVLPRSLAETGAPNSHNALAGLAGLAVVLVGLPFCDSRRKWIDRITALKGAFQIHPYRFLVLLFILTAIVAAAAAPEFSVQASQGGRSAEKRYYYHANHLGSINVVTDEKGKVVERREYKPYGEQFDWTGPNSGPRDFLQTFDGQYYDGATGLYYFGARHYDPQLGRFLAADTQVPDPNNPKDLHRYAFAGDNPIRYVDPTGHELGFWDWVLGIVIILAVVALGVISCGAIWYLGIAFFSMAGGLLFTVGMAAIGAGITGSIYLAQDKGPLSNPAEFFSALAVGAIIGAAAAILGLVIWYGAGAVGAYAVIKNMVVAAITAGLGDTIAHLASGGSPSAIFSNAVGLRILTVMGFGAAAAFFAGLAGVGGLSLALIRSFEFLAAGCSIMATVLITAEAANWFRNSPSKPLGIPAWAFTGTGAYSGRNESQGLALQLQTMPFAP